jgi:hypothetical protein
MNITVHEGGFGRCSLQVELETQDPPIRRRVRRAYGGEPKTWMSMFAGSLEDAREAVVAQVRGNWLRHQDPTTDWVAQTVQKDGAPASRC